MEITEKDEGRVAWQAHNVTGASRTAKHFSAIAPTAKQALQAVLAEMRAAKSRSKELVAVKGALEAGGFAYFPVSCERVRIAATDAAVEGVTQ